MLFTLPFFIPKTKSHIRNPKFLLLPCTCKWGKNMRENIFSAIDKYERSIIIQILKA